MLTYRSFSNHAELKIRDQCVCIVSARELVQNRVNVGSPGNHLISYLAGLGVEDVQDPTGP